jgi:putative transposase
MVPLSEHILTVISAAGIEVRSFMITSDPLSLSIRKEVSSYVPKSFCGVDRNASNVTCGNPARVIRFSLRKVESIARATRQIVRSFEGNDVRIRKKLFAKYGRRRSKRVRKIIHHMSKTVVSDAKERQAAIVFEDIEGLRKLYMKGNFQGKNFRVRMNSVPCTKSKDRLSTKLHGKEFQ